MPDHHPVIYPPLLPDCLAYRTVTKPGLLDKASGKVLLGTFLRKGPHPDTGQLRDEDGVSVDLRGDRSVNELVLESKRFWGKSCRAVCEVSVGHIRHVPVALELGMVIDVVQDQPYHANIIGLPRPATDEEMATEEGRLATQLAESLALKICNGCIVVWPEGQHP